MARIQRVKTGIKGFDKLVSGGVPKGSTVLVSGGPGAGKTIFCIEYLYRGALNKERVLYIGTEQKKEDIYKQAALFGWNLEPLENQGLFHFAFLDFKKGQGKVDGIRRLIRKVKPARVVIDSLARLITSYPIITEVPENILKGGLDKTMTAIIGTPQTLIGEKIFPLPLTQDLINMIIARNLFDALKENGSITTLVTTEAELKEESERFSRDGFSEFMADGLILMFYTGLAGEESRNLSVRKMRYTPNMGGIVSFIMGKEGIEIKAEEARSVVMK